MLQCACQVRARTLCPEREEDDVTAGLTREDGAEAHADEFEEEGQEEDAA